MSASAHDLPLRDELPFRNLERAIIRLAACKRELDRARADCDQIMASMTAVGLTVTFADAGLPTMPLMAVE